jgi:hypothetical protein
MRWGRERRREQGLWSGWAGKGDDNAFEIAYNI